MGEDSQRRISKQDYPGFLEGKEGSASSLPTDIQSILLTTSAGAITIPVTLYKMENRKITETTALIDSGATICCINLHFTQRMRWLLEKLCQPMYARNADRTHNSRGMICHQVKLHLWINERNMVQNFFMLNLGKQDNIILGYPWLTKNNPRIDWTTGEVHMIGTPIPHHDELKIVEQCYLLCYCISELWKGTNPSMLPKSMPSKEHSNSPKSARRGSFPHPKTHPFYCPSPSSRKSGTETPSTVHPIFRSIQ